MSYNYAAPGDSRRRQVEAEKLHRFVPSGPWDADCEANPEASYEWDIGAGFKARIWRDQCWYWIGSITFPSWYPFRSGYHPSHFTSAIGVDGDEYYVPPSPVKIRYADNDIYNFSYERELRDACPLNGKPKLRQSYKGLDRMIEDMWLLVGHLVSILYTHKDAQMRCASDAQRAGIDKAFRDNQEALLQIREQEMRVWLATKERREAEAAQEATWAAEDAAATRAREEAAARIVKKQKEAYARVREAARTYYKWFTRVTNAQKHLDHIIRSHPEREGDRELFKIQASEPHRYTEAKCAQLLKDIERVKCHQIFLDENLTATLQVRALQRYLLELNDFDVANDEVA